MSDQPNRSFGLTCAVAAQLLWGVFPLYLAVLVEVDSVDFVAHRILWAFVLLLAGLVVAKFFLARPMLTLLPEPQALKRMLADGEACGILFSASLLIAINWLTFVWAANHDHKVDASLGYFVCPHVVVLLGVFFLREKLAKIQWVAIVLTAIGVAVMAMSNHGLPFVGLAIALSFGLYALVKKKVNATPLNGLLMETGFLVIPAVIYLLYRWPSESLVWLDPWWMNVLLFLSGLFTILPLALYAAAVKHIRLSTMGLLQYIAPTIQFLVGVFLFHEAFDKSRGIGFVFVWTGVVLFMWAVFVKSRAEAAQATMVADPK